MSRSRTITGSRQRLGRRLALTTYYQINEQRDDYLQCESFANANQQAGIGILAGGAVLMLLAVVIVFSGFSAGAQGGGFGAYAIATIIGGLLAGFGYRQIVGGYAVMTTRNTLIADGAEQELRLEQTNRIAGERIQRIGFAQISGVRLRRRPLIIGRILRRVIQIVALEIIVDEEHVWVIDTDIEVEQLRPIAEGLSTVLQRELTGTS
jgi:hypothetical protein